MSKKRKNIITPKILEFLASESFKCGAKGSSDPTTRAIKLVHRIAPKMTDFANETLKDFIVASHKLGLLSKAGEV